MNNQQEQQREESLPLINETYDKLGINYSSRTQNQEVKTLQECKDEIARKHSFTIWEDVVDNASCANRGIYSDEAAELYASQFKTTQEWISVNDRLPEHGQKVDLWLVHKDEEKSHRISWTWEKQDTSELKINEYKATHWMPLPGNPKP